MTIELDEYTLKRLREFGELSAKHSAIVRGWGGTTSKESMAEVKTLEARMDVVAVTISGLILAKVESQP